MGRLQPVSHSLMSSILTQRTQLTGTTCHLLHFLELIMIISTQCYLDVTYFQRKTKTLYIWFGAMIATYVSSCFKSNYYYNQCPAIQDAVKEEFPNSHHCHFLWHIMKKILEKLGAFAQYKATKKMSKRVVYETMNS